MSGQRKSKLVRVALTAFWVLALAILPYSLEGEHIGLKRMNAGAEEPADKSLEEPILRIDPQGHMGDIQKIMFTKDGRHLISASNDKTVRIWDVESGRCIRTILGQVDLGKEGMVYYADLSPDGFLLATAGWFGPTNGYKLEDLGRIRIYDFETGEILALLAGHRDVVNVLAFSPDGRFLASGSHDMTVRLWSVDGVLEEAAVLKGHTDHVYALAFSPDSSLLVSAADDHTLRLWRVGDGSEVAVLKGHKDKVRAVQFSPDGKYIYSASWDKTIKIWDAKDGALIKDLAEQDTIPNGLFISPDGSRIVTGTYTTPNYCYVYGSQTGEKLASFKLHDNNVGAVTISPDGQLAASGGGNDYPIFLWSLDTGKVVKSLKGVGASVWNVGITANGGEIAWSNTGSEARPLFRGPLEQAVRLQRGPHWGVWLIGDIDDETRYSEALEEHDSKHLQPRVGGKYGVEAFLDVMEGEKKILEIERDATSGYAHLSYTFSPDGKIIVSGGYNGALLAYDVGTGKKLVEFVGHEAEVYALAVSEDGRYLVSGSKDQTIRLWALGEIPGQKIVYPLLSIFVGTNHEWVAWTPEGYYSCSLKGDRYIGWHVNHGVDRQAEFLPAERFVKKFYRPDVVSAVLKTGSMKKGIELASIKKETESEVKVSQILPPSVMITDPRSRFIETEDPEFTIKGLARSVSREPITAFKILHNGRPVVERKVVIRQSQNKLRSNIISRITLKPGENNLTLIAANRSAQSNPVSIVVVYKGEPAAGDELPPNLYVLAVGVSKYLDSELDINLAHKDAIAVSDALKKQVGHLYKDVQVRLLTDQQATRVNVLDGLNWLLKKATKRDVAIMFLAGHGVNDEMGRYYFISHDTDVLDLRTSAVGWQNFMTILLGIPSKVVLMADTCHSGAITGSRLDEKPGLTDMTSALKEVVASGTEVMVMAASTGDGVSQEKTEWGHGAFTKALLDGIYGGADYNKNTEVDIFEINLFTTHKVNELTQGAQRPSTEIPASLPNFPLVKILESAGKEGQAGG